MSNMQNKEKQLNAEDFILEEKVTGSDCPFLMAPDFPREVTYKLMEDYAAYKLMLRENQTKKQVKEK